MATRNDVTGDKIVSKPTNDQYRNNYDAIFRRPKYNVRLIKAVVPCLIREPHQRPNCFGHEATGVLIVLDDGDNVFENSSFVSTYKPKPGGYYIIDEDTKETSYVTEKPA